MTPVIVLIVVLIVNVDDIYLDVHVCVRVTLGTTGRVCRRQFWMISLIQIHWMKWKMSQVGIR